MEPQHQFKVYKEGDFTMQLIPNTLYTSDDKEMILNKLLVLPGLEMAFDIRNKYTKWAIMIYRYDSVKKEILKNENGVWQCLRLELLDTFLI